MGAKQLRNRLEQNVEKSHFAGWEGEETHQTRREGEGDG